MRHIDNHGDDLLSSCYRPADTQLQLPAGEVQTFYLPPAHPGPLQLGHPRYGERRAPAIILFEQLGLRCS